MKASTIIPIIVGGIAALVALNRGIFKEKEPPKPQYLVSRITMPTTQPVKPEFIGAAEWSKEGPLPEEYVRKEDQVGIQGRFVKKEIQKGQPITEADLFPADVISYMDAMLTSHPDMRGHPVGVKEVTGGGGFVQPGDIICVMAQGNLVGKGDKGIKSKFIGDLQRVVVLAVNRRDTPRTSAVQSSGKGKGKGKKQAAEKLRYVTLLVTPEQSERLGAIEKAGGVTMKLILVGRNAKPVETSGASLADALDIPAPPPEEVVTPPIEKTRLVAGEDEEPQVEKKEEDKAPPAVEPPELWEVPVQRGVGGPIQRYVFRLVDEQRGLWIRTGKGAKGVAAKERQGDSVAVSDEESGRTGRD